MNVNFELDRILDLPQIPDLTESEIDQLSDKLILRSARNEGYRLLEAQANMIAQYVNFGGLFANAAAGSGKTMTCFLIHNLSLDGRYVPKVDRVLHLLPSDLIRQCKADVKVARKKIHFPNNVFYFSDLKGSRESYKDPETGYYSHRTVNEC